MISLTHPIPWKKIWLGTSIFFVIWLVQLIVQKDSRTISPEDHMATQNQPNHPTDVVLHATVIQGAAGFTITNHDDLSYENVVLSCEACLRSGGRNTRVELSASAPDIDVGQSVSLPFSALQYEDSNTPFDSRRLRLTRVTVTCEVGYADGSFSQQLGPEPEGEVPID